MGFKLYGPAKDEGLIRRWVAALRSGRYIQTDNSLSDKWSGAEGGWPEKNCCLGVLCRVARIGDDWRDESLLSDGNYATQQLMNRVGLDQPFERRLAELNDEGTSFSTIADLIEERMLKE